MKKVSLLLCLALAGVSVSAQTSEKPGRLTTFKQNGFGDNWFIGAGAGGSVYFGPEDQHASFLDRVTVNPTVFVGKWFNPYIGTRLAIQGGKIHSFAGNDAQKMYSMTHFNAHVDMMFNATNYFCKYDANRFYNFIPTVGIGYDKRDRNGALLKWHGFQGFTFNASLLNTFRLTDKLSAFVEVGGAFIESRFDKGNRGGKPWNGIANGNAGLILNFGGTTTFSEAVLMDEGLLNDLNSQINKLRSENAELRKRPERCEDVKCPPVVTPPTTLPPTTGTYVPNVVFFRLNSAVIDKNQEISIYNTAEYMKANPNARVKVVGYADKQTGTAAYNLKLSERRANNVANALINKYKISRDRVKVEWKGSSEQPYKENAWNRVAIFFAE